MEGTHLSDLTTSIQYYLLKITAESVVLWFGFKARMLSFSAKPAFHIRMPVADVLKGIPK